MAKAAVKEGRTIREQVIEMGYVERGDLTEEQLDAALDVLSMTHPSSNCADRGFFVCTSTASGERERALAGYSVRIPPLSS